MNPPSQQVCLAILDNLCTRSRIVLVLADADGRIRWASKPAEETFPDCFCEGQSFDASLARCTATETEGLASGSFAGGFPEAELRRSTLGGAGGGSYRYFHTPLGEAGKGFVLHYLVNVSEEKSLKERFLYNLQQLKLTREIVDVLYESLGTQEVIYLILVAVTSQIGFGFNRAFFLHTRGNRLRGRIGIGPSNHEEAHQIWTRIASLNFSSLREVYNDLTQNGEMPDLRTQEIALQLDFDLSGYGLTGTGRGWGDTGESDRDPAELEGPTPRLLSALRHGKPICLECKDPATEVDRKLFDLLSTDAVAVVPLLVRGRLAGVILADNFITRRPITEADLSVLKTFAGYAGVALERSHLYDELRESVAKLRVANETLKANQQKLLHAEKLSAIGELAAYVSHEIRNPLVAIGGLARSLLKEDFDDPDTVETLQIIVSEVNRLEKFLKDTLDFVKPRVADPVSTDLNDAVRDCLATFNKEMSGSSIEVEVDLAEEPLRGMLDRALLHHALSNLVKNAVEAVGSDGKVYVGTRREGAMVVLRVGDTGPGVPPDVLPRIFDPFFTTKSEGTGLGLSLASQNIRSLGGQLELVPEAGFSTLFQIKLPLHGCRSSGDVEKNYGRKERPDPKEETEFAATSSGGGHENRSDSR